MVDDAEIEDKMMMMDLVKYSVNVSAKSRIEHQKLNQMVLKGRLVEFLLFNSIHRKKVIPRKPCKACYTDKNLQIYMSSTFEDI